MASSLLIVPRFATLRLGGSRQPIHTDLDMLTADFAITSTSSTVGTKFDEFFSDSFGMLDIPFVVTMTEP